MLRLTLTLGLWCLPLLAAWLTTATAEADARRDAVRGLRPVGHWPADEGAGEVLHDRSATGNHGTIYNVPWRDGLLDFSPFTYQWVHVPHHLTYASAEFSMGGWVFCRTAYRQSRVLLIGQPFEAGKDAWRWTGFGGTVPAGGALLYLQAPAEGSGAMLAGVASGGKEDVIGSVRNRTALATNAWNHVLYAFDATGTGRLYLNGQLAQTAQDVPYQGAETPFAIGSDLRQWQPYQPNGRSLDGCVRDLVLFDRALGLEEVERLYQAGAPAVRPGLPSPGVVLRDPRDMSLEGLNTGAPAERRAAWEALAGEDRAGSEWFPGDLPTSEDEARWAVRLRGMAASLVPLAAGALADPETRLPATRVLAALGTEASRQTLSGTALPLLTRTVCNPSVGSTERAEAALALAAMGPAAAGAVPTLVEVLETIVRREGACLPRIEDVARNAVMRALLDVAPQDARVREVLGRALAQPWLEALDLTRPHLVAVRELAVAGRYLDALDALRAQRQAVPALPGQRAWGHADPRTMESCLPLRPEYADTYLSRGNAFSDAPHYPPRFVAADYTPVAVHGGVVYVAMVERLEFAAVEAEFARSLQTYTTARPSPDAKWSRAKIVRIGPDGARREAFLGGDWFIFDARDQKMDGWAIGLDRDGTVHVVGGQHNTPSRASYLPGVWEKMGLPADPAQAPRAMYWVSERPGDITSLQFVGQRGNPREIPCGWLNYMNFARSPDGTLFVYGRDAVWTWGLYRYDAGARRWTGVGGSVPAMLADARTTTPAWVRSLGPTVPYYGPASEPALVGAWQPGAYNFNRTSWGVRFDRTGRMHLQMSIWGVGEGARLTDGPIYAYSDDKGETFHRADGASLKLPLTVNPIPGHDAHMDRHRTRQWFALWTSLIRHAGDVTSSAAIGVRR